MKKGKRRMLAVLLTASVCCSGFAGAAQARSAGWDGGWMQDENHVWTYYDKTGENEYEPRTNNFAPSSTDDADLCAMYYLDKDGHLVLDENGLGSTVTGPDGKDYELTAGGAVKGGQLGKIASAEETLIWYTEPMSGVLARYWWHLEDEGEKYWFYFDSRDKHGKAYKRGQYYAQCSPVKMINKKWYSFDEKGHMAENKFVPIYDENEGRRFMAYAQCQGDFATNKWLSISGQWYYFAYREFKNWDGDKSLELPVAMTGIYEIDGVSYEFDENGSLTSDNAPYRLVDEIEISSKKDSAYVGDKLTIAVDIQVATDSNASAATMSNAEKAALEDGKVYDAYMTYEGPGIGYGAKIFPGEGGKATRVTFVPTMEGEYKFKLYIDGMTSNTLTIPCHVNPEKTEDPDYMKDVISGILDSKLSGEEIIDQLIQAYSQLGEDAAAKITEMREDSAALQQLAAFEEAYVKGQGMGRYKKELDQVKGLMDTDEISVVGAFLNADSTASEPVVFSMKKDTTTDVSQIQGDRKIPLDISLEGGNIDTSSLSIPLTMTMPIPNGVSKNGLKLFHIHNGEVEEVPLSQALLNSGKARFTASSLSTFVFVGNPVSQGSSGGSSGGFGRPGSPGKSSAIAETPGTWRQVTQGWQFQKADGTLYQNTWIYVNGRWYWMEQNGMMAAGFKVLDGKRYYLMPGTGQMAVGWFMDGESWYYAGANGEVQTGWVQSGGKWYYLAQDGHMLSSAVTPDQYRVDESGAWIQE